jgi:hypothetical protein
MRRSLFINGLTVVFGLALQSCESDQDSNERDRRSGSIHVAPIEAVVLSEWWTNGYSLLRLRPQGGYEVFAGGNRYEAPAERGRWTQRSHVALEFDPYAALHSRVERVQIDRDSEGGPVLILRDDRPFVPLDAPPLVLEDSLFGQWRADGFLLSLNRAMRYSLRRADGSGDVAVAVAGHEGAWRIREGVEVVLVPDAPGLEPVVLKLQGGDDITLAGAERVDTIR